MRRGRVLVLGGTTEARQLAGALTERGEFSVISSLAGRTGKPLLPAGELRIGGFGGAEGLAEWLRAERISALVDATHPFAARISASALAASAATGVPLLVLRRPGWTAGPGDDWRRVRSLAEAAAALPGVGRRALLTTGRQGLAAFAGLDNVWFLVRAVDPPVAPVPRRMRVLLERGPFTVAGELALLGEHSIDVLVTKDSGGTATVAKLIAARQLGLPVLMVDRPPQVAGPQEATPQEAGPQEATPEVATVGAALAWLAAALP